MFISAFSLSSFHWREVAEVGEAGRMTAAAALMLRGGGTNCKQQVGGSIILQEGVSSACPLGGKRDRGVDGFTVASAFAAFDAKGFALILCRSRERKKRLKGEGLWFRSPVSVG